MPPALASLLQTRREGTNKESATTRDPGIQPRAWNPTGTMQARPRRTCGQPASPGAASGLHPGPGGRRLWEACAALGPASRPRDWATPLRQTRDHAQAAALGDEYPLPSRKWPTEVVALKIKGFALFFIIEVCNLLQEEMDRCQT